MWPDHYQNIMSSQRPKGRRLSSFRRLICSSNKDRDHDYDEDGAGREDPLAFTTTDGNENVRSILNTPSFEAIYSGTMVDLDDSVESFDLASEPKSVVKDIKHSSSSSSKKSRMMRKMSSSSRASTPSRTIPKHWHGDGGDDQPVQSFRFDESAFACSSPSRNTTTSRREDRTQHIAPCIVRDDGHDVCTSPASVAESLGLDMESLGNTSLIKRVEMVKARAEHLLQEAQKKQKKQNSKQHNSCGASVKSIGSSVLTEPTMEATFSASSRSHDTMSEKIKRLQQTKSKLQRFADEFSETSTIRSDIVNPAASGRSVRNSYRRRPSGFGLDSSDEESFPEGATSTAESGDVLHIISMLEAINGYDLSLRDDTMDESTILDLDLSFLKP